MNTTFRTTGLAQTTGSTRDVFSLFRRYWVRFRNGAKNGANDRGNAPSCTA